MKLKEQEKYQEDMIRAEVNLITNWLQLKGLCPEDCGAARENFKNVKFCRELADRVIAFDETGVWPERR